MKENTLADEGNIFSHDSSPSSAVRAVKYVLNKITM